MRVALEAIGAVVGGCFCAGKLPQLAEFATTLTKRRVVGLMDFHIGGAGLIAGGAIGNAIDRLRFGKVVDFVTFMAAFSFCWTLSFVWIFTTT